MGKVDQGVFSLWIGRHLAGGALTYNGWGGSGKQARDLLHVDDLTHERDGCLGCQVGSTPGARPCAAASSEAVNP